MYCETVEACSRIILVIRIASVSTRPQNRNKGYGGSMMKLSERLSHAITSGTVASITYSAIGWRFYFEKGRLEMPSQTWRPSSLASLRRKSMGSNSMTIFATTFIASLPVENVCAGFHRRRTNVWFLYDAWALYIKIKEPASHGSLFLHFTSKFWNISQLPNQCKKPRRIRWDSSEAKGGA